MGFYLLGLCVDKIRSSCYGFLDQTWFFLFGDYWILESWFSRRGVFLGLQVLK